MEKHTHSSHIPSSPQLYMACNSTKNVGCRSHKVRQLVGDLSVNNYWTMGIQLINLGKL